MHMMRTGPALTRKGRLLMYALSLHSECTRNNALAKEPTKRPSPGTSRLARSTHTLRTLAGCLSGTHPL